MHSFIRRFFSQFRINIFWQCGYINLKKYVAVYISNTFCSNRIDSKLNDLCCSHLILWSMIIARATTIKVSPRFYRWSSSNADAVIIIIYLAIMCFSLWTDFVNINSSFVCSSSICTFCLFFKSVSLCSPWLWCHYH